MPIEHTRLLTDRFKENPFWTAITSAMDAVINPCVQNAAEKLGQLRYPGVEPYFANLNIRMLGFKISSLAFTPEEYVRVMKTLGTYFQICGSDKTFMQYLSYIKNVELIYLDLWADSLDMPIEQLTAIHETEIWNGGNWFPTSYFDVVYSKVDFPDIDEDQFRNFIYQLAPEHLVLRQLVGIAVSTVEIYLTAIPLDRQRTTTIARPLTS